MLKSKKGNSTALALVYAVTYLNQRVSDDEDSDDDVGAMESIAATLANCTPAELDLLSQAAQQAFKEEKRSSKPRQDFLDDYASWMESMFGDEWDGNKRQAEE